MVGTDGYLGWKSRVDGLGSRTQVQSLLSTKSRLTPTLLRFGQEPAVHRDSMLSTYDCQLRQVALGDRSFVFAVDQVSDAAEQPVAGIIGQRPMARVGTEQVQVVMGGVRLLPLVASELHWAE